MKMGVGTRVVFSLFILVIIALCVGIILAAFGVFSPDQVAALTNGFESNKYIWAGAALVVALVGLCLLFFGIRKKKGASETPAGGTVTLALTADGGVSITLPALEELAKRFLNDVYGIMTQRITVGIMNERNIRIDISICVKPEVQMPDISDSVTQGLREYIEKYSGVCVGYVGISIEPLNPQAPLR